jgi:hypothetical protein
MYKKTLYPSTNISYDFDLAIEILKGGKGLLITECFGAYRVSSQNSLSTSAISNKVNYTRINQLKSYLDFSDKNNIDYFYAGVFSLYSILIISLKGEKINFKLFYLLKHMLSFKIFTKLPLMLYKRLVVFVN